MGFPGNDILECGLRRPNYVAEKQVPRPISINTQIEVIEAEATATAKLLAPKTPNLSVEEVGALKLQAENLLLQVIKKQEVILDILRIYKLHSPASDNNSSRFLLNLHHLNTYKLKTHFHPF